MAHMLLSLTLCLGMGGIAFSALSQEQGFPIAPVDEGAGDIKEVILREASEVSRICRPYFTSLFYYVFQYGN